MVCGCHLDDLSTFVKSCSPLQRSPSPRGQLALVGPAPRVARSTRISTRSSGGQIRTRPRPTVSPSGRAIDFGRAPFDNGHVLRSRRLDEPGVAARCGRLAQPCQRVFRRSLGSANWMGSIAAKVADLGARDQRSERLAVARSGGDEQIRILPYGGSRPSRCGTRCRPADDQGPRPDSGAGLLRQLLDLA